MAFKTQPNFTAAFTLYLLKSLRGSQGRFRSASDIVANAEALLRDDKIHDFGIPQYMRLQFAQDVLQDLTQLGMVRARRDGEQQLYQGSFGDGPPRDGGDGGGQVPDGGGSGMAAVLGHRILFSLDEADFAVAVDRSLEIY
jgi:hypothetical protein